MKNKNSILDFELFLIDTESALVKPFFHHPKAVKSVIDCAPNDLQKFKGRTTTSGIAY
jgi:hypothetical protein